MGRQRANNSVDQAPSKSCGKVPGCPIPHNSTPHPDFNLRPTLISKTELLVWEEWKKVERGRKRGGVEGGGNGGIIGLYSFQSCVFFFFYEAEIRIQV